MLPNTQKNPQSDTKAQQDQSFAVSPPSINLPKGGGAIRGIGEKFAANPVTGTGSMSVPIATSPGRSGFGPQLSLSYDSGSGNGPFGFGWSLSLPSITRKTDKGLPRYLDVRESDTFILSGAEDLVPVMVRRNGRWIRQEFDRAVNGVNYRIQRYRPRIEGLFARIERWTNMQTGEIHWRSISRDNIITLYGKTKESRIADPADPLRVFRWLICESYDDKGNAIAYGYKLENSEGIDVWQAHERNRTEFSRSANRYLKRIKYGNRVSRLIEPDVARGGWHFEVVFDYGEHDLDTPTPDETKEWLCRHDAFSSYRATFEVRTYRLCQRVLMFHHFPEEEEVGADCLVRSTDFVYRNIRENEEDLRKGHPVASFIASVTQSGYRRKGDSYLKRSLPPLEFEYSQAIVHEAIQEIDSQSLENLPIGLDGTSYQWVDLDGEGVSGLLTEQGDNWFYKPGLGMGRFGPVKNVGMIPSLANLNGGRQQLLDIAGDGQLDLADFRGTTPGFFERTMDQGWELFRPFRSLPAIRWDDPNLRFIDLTGDGHADILITEDDVFTWYASLAEVGFAAAERIQPVFEEDHGPRLALADSTQSIYLADMSGDGLTDIVRIRNGEVCYWPNLGYGRFGDKVTMDHAPWFDAPDLFDQRRIRVADIDGSGNTDIIYLSQEGAKIFFNQSGNRWSEARILRQFPRIDNIVSVTAVDLLGNGTACLVWSSPLLGDVSGPMKYIDLMGGQKPHLLISVINNLGAESHVTYAPSTKFYLADKAAGKPWITRLPFPVYVVERVETIDRISRNRFVTRYTYHHGNFDGVERGFHGFGLVVQYDTEQFATLSASENLPEATNIDSASHVPPVIIKTWFHTGAFVEEGRISKQFEDEYYREGDCDDSLEGLSEEQQQAMLLPDTMLPDVIRGPEGVSIPWRLSTEEIRQACRALKGSLLRQEIYAQDGSEAEARPYSVSEHNYTIELLQPVFNRANSPEHDFAVYLVHARETVDFHYERKMYRIGSKRLADPRVTHQMTLVVDDYGDVLQSVSIGYGRRHDDPDPILTAEDREKQRHIHLSYSENRYTNAVDQENDYRTPLLCETRTYELLKIRPDSNQPQVTNLFQFSEMILKVQLSAKYDVPYQQWNVYQDDLSPTTRRLIEHLRTLYRSNDLTGALPLGAMESLALPFESYKLGFTPDLLVDLYGEKVNDGMLVEGGYVQDELDWWVPSGRIFYSAEEQDTFEAELEYARKHFFIPLRFHNPFGAVTKVVYDQYDVLTAIMRDAIGNLISAGERDQDGHLVTIGNDYRVLQPQLVMDSNRNRASVAYDAIGMVVGTAVMGKPEEHAGDSLAGFVSDLDDELILAYLSEPLKDPYALLQEASTRLVYDLFAYIRSRESTHPQPAVVASLARETHTSDLLPEQSTRIQHSFSYSDGSGREIQKKVQAEPGPLKEGGPDIAPRHIASGSVDYNNKGKPWRQFEPFFSATHVFEFAVHAGVSAVLFYDPVERVVATLHPNDSWEKVVFDPWRQETWDVNDTVLLDPREDSDVRGYVKQYLDGLDGRTGGWKSWYAQRVDGALGDQEQQAAEKTAAHTNTPTCAWMDSLGRRVITVAHNRLYRGGAVSDEYYATRAVLDIEGNQRDVIDALGRSVMRYGFDMLGNAQYQASMESGTRWNLNDVGNSPIYTWNSRGFRLHMEYDQLRRPIRQWVQEGNGQELLAERTLYGEIYPNAAALNLRGKSYYQFDNAGVVRHDRYDYKGNLLLSTRRLSKEYRRTATWHELEIELNVESLKIESIEDKLESLLEDTKLCGETAYDAHNRPIKVKSPDATIAFLTYNEANLLERLDAQLGESATRKSFINDVDYDAHGRRQYISYGNGVTTSFKYDDRTFRLSNLKTVREGSVLQDFQYTYDAAGNITSIEDAVQPLIYFNNAAVSANTAYVYDALYQLAGATGREHIGLAGTSHPDWGDKPRSHLPHPNDGQSLRRYSEQYQYDQVGNILETIHTAVNGNWRREYRYAETSLLEQGQVNNRLSSTSVGEATEQYSYDLHGNTTAIPHLPTLNWDHEDQLQNADLLDGGRAFYIYDTAGRRVRKVIERQNGTRQKERIYVGGFEIYREYASDGDAIKLERQTLHIVDDKQRLAFVETKTFDRDVQEDAPEPIIRYQLSSHLDSTTLELDKAGAIISYEEYYPFGGTSYQAGRNAVEVSEKRYRYTGKERDEETGFYYHGARYYVPWLGRWISCDPAALVDGSNVYRYVKNNPINTTDPTGMWEMPSWRTIAVVAAVVVVGTVLTVATAGVAGPLVVGAVASIGLTGTAATVVTGVAVGAIAGAVGGAAAGAAGEATRQTVNSRALGMGTEEFSGGKILSAAGEGAVTGAAIGAAVGGAAAFATTAVGTAAIGAVGKVAQRVIPGVVRSGASTVARGVGAVANAAGRAPGIRQAISATSRGLQAIEGASARLGTRAAQGVFSEGSAGAQAVERFAQTGSYAKTFGADKASQEAAAASTSAGVTSSTGEAGTTTAQTLESRTFTSGDPLVADLANKIEAAYPGHVVGVNVTVEGAAAVQEVDILLRNAAIQVKSGGGKGLTSQLLRTEQATGLPSIGYGPNLGPHVVKGIQRAGGLVTKDEALLIQVVRP